MPRVIYNGLIVDIRDEDLESAIADLSQSSADELEQVLASVRAALDEAVDLVAAGKQDFSSQQLQNIANDICLWFAGEVLAGRSEDYKQAVQ